MKNEKFKKIEKEFCLGDSSVNVYGYRLLTTGFRQDLYARNPIGFEMHEKGREKGVLVRWEDLRVDGDKIFAKPVINLYHPDGQKTVDEIEAGFKNAASMGKIIVLSATDDEKLKLKDQTGPTVTEWYPREISFVDIPGNHNALANLYDMNENALDLADFITNNIKKEDKMSKVILTAAMLSLMDLTDQSSEVEVSKKLQDLADTAAKVPGLEKDLADKSTALTAKEKELADLKASTIVKEVQDLIAKGQADKKLTVEVANKLKVSFADNPSGLKDLIDAMPAQTLVTGGNDDTKDLASFEGQKWDELYAAGKLQVVKDKYPDLYEKLKNEKYPNLKD